MNSKLLEILRSFSPIEWDQFENYIISYDATSSRKYYPIVKTLKLYSGSDRLNSISFQSIFRKAYEGNFKPQTISNRQSELLKLSLFFLEDLALQKNILLKDVLLSSELIARNLLKNYSRFLNKKNKLRDSSLYNEERYEYLKKLELDDAAYNQMIKAPTKIVAMKYFDYSSLVLANSLNSLCKTALEILMLEKTTEEKFENNYHFDIIDSLDSSGFFQRMEVRDKNIFISSLIRFYIYKGELHPGKPEYIIKAEKVYFDHEENFPTQFKIEVYRKLMSYYTEKINKGEMKYHHNNYKLINRKLKQNLTEDISRPTGHNLFRDYIINGIFVKKYGWVEKLISRYANLLPEEMRELIVSVSFVRLHFAKGHYEKALDIINNIHTSNLIYYIDVIVYKLSSLYELGEYEQANSEILKTKRHIRNITDNSGFIYSFKKFLKYYQQALKVKTDPNRDRDYFVYRFSKDSASFVFKHWLNEKVKELSK